MKTFRGIPQKLVSLLLAVIMVMTMLPAQGLLSVAAAEATGITAQEPEGSTGLPEEGAGLPEEDTGLPGEGTEVPPEIFQLTINYMYGESAGVDLAGSTAAQTHVKTLALGSEYSIVSPTITGFTPDTEIVEGILADDTDIVVTYEAADSVEYTVVHTFEGLLADGSDKETVTETKYGAVGALTEADAKDETGFTAGDFAQTEIAPDGSTSIAIDYSRNEYAVYFSTNGGSYVDTQIKKLGEAVSLDAVVEPQKSGYGFGGWFSDAACTITAQTSFTMPAQDVELYALWNDENGKYTAVVWLEQADPNASGSYDYDFALSQEQSAAVKSTVTTADAYNALKSRLAITDIYEYDASTVGNEQTVTLSGDGTEVLNIYLKRKEITVTFHAEVSEVLYDGLECTMLGSPAYGYHNADGTHHFLKPIDEIPDFFVHAYPCQSRDGTWYQPHVTLPEWRVWKTVTGRAGERFDARSNEQWPDTLDGKPVQWLKEKPIPFTNIPYFAKMERIPLVDTDCYAELADANKGLYRLNYALEMLSEDTSTPDVEKDGKRYKLHSYKPTFFHSSLKVSEAEDAIEIAGFTYSRVYDDYAEAASVRETKSYDAYLYYNRNPATISFSAPDAVAGTVPSSITLPFGATVSVPTVTPQRTGYSFKGWNNEPLGNGQAFTFDANTTMPAGGASLYAVWEPLIYNVTFDLNYTDAPTAAVEQVAYQKLATKPADTVRDGYRFMGWYTTATGSQRYVFDKPVVDNITLFAQWTKSEFTSYTVKHVDVDSGAVLHSEIKNNIKVGTTVTVRARTFAGYAPLVTSTSRTIVAGDNEIVLEYKKFTALPYTVKYVDEENEQIAPEKYVANNSNLLTTVTENAITVEGYTPKRYQQTLNLVADEAQNVITFIYTKNKPGTYIVNHYVAGENNNYKLDYTDAAVELPVGDRATATPKADVLVSHDVNTGMSNLSGIINPGHVNSPLVLSVYYDWKEYDVTYNPNNSVPGNNAVTQPVKHGKNTTAKPADTFTAEPHEVFLGWAENANATTPTYKAGDSINNVTAPKTLYAVWVLEDKYSITYNANNGSLGTQTYDGGNHFADEPATALGNDVTSFTEPVGKKFDGWSTTPNGTVEFAAGTEIPMTDKANKQLYAVWGDRDQNTITYNGGSMSGVSGTLPGGATTEQQKRFNNQTGTVKANSFVLDGYKFDGWKDEQNKSWAVNETVPAGTDLTLTAQWAIDDAQWVTLTYDANGGADAPAQEKILRSALKATLAGKGGMAHGTNIFGGWSLNTIAPIATKAEYDVAQSQLITEISFNTAPSYTVNAVWYVDVNGPTGTDDGTPDALQHKASYNGNGNTSGTAPVDTNLYSKNDKVKVQSGDALGRTEAVIIGWSTELVSNVLATKEQENTVVNGGKFYTAGKEYTMADAAVTFHAVWAVDKNGDGTPDYDQLTVSYLPGATDATGTTVDATLYNSNDEVTVKDNGFVRTDYMFTHWVGNGGTVAAPSNKFQITASTTFTAQWKLDKNGPEGGPDQIPDEDEFGITYFANGGTGDVPVNTNIYPVDYDAPVEFVTNLTKTGHTFLGWDTDASALTPTYTAGGTTTVPMVQGGVKLHAIYGANTVSYNVYHVGSRSGDNNVDLGHELGKNGTFGETLTLNAKDPVGYTLTGTTTQTVTLGETGADVNNITFHYIINKYDVVYKPNNNASSSDITEKVEHGAGTSAKPADTFVADTHMVFVGWDTNPNATVPTYKAGDPISNITGNMDLYAIWVLEDKYSITYNANNDNQGTQTHDGGKHFADEPATALGNDVTGFTEPVGKKFDGWSTTPNGTVEFAAGTEIPMTDKANKQLYAVWGDRDQNTITYNGGSMNGVSGTLPGGATTEQQKRFNNQTGKVKANSFVLDGYKFTGWSDGAKSWAVNETVPAGTDLTLTAQWEIDDAQWVTLTYDANGGADAPAPEKILRSALKATLAGKGGMTHGTNIFGGWSLNTIALIATKAEYDAAQSQLITEISFNTAPSYTVNAVWYVDVNGPTGTDDGTPDALQFKVTYVGGADDATGSTVDNNLYSTTDNVTLKASGFARTNYVFSGWSVASQANIWQPAQQISIAGDTEVTALWKEDKNGPEGEPDGTEDAIQYAVTYDANGGTGSVPENTNIYSVDYPAPVAFTPAPTKDGYTFLGWDTKADAKAPTYTTGGTTTVPMVQGGVKLYAIYGAQDVTYVVQYISVLDGVDKTLDTDTGSGKFDQALTLSAKTFTGYTLTSAATQDVTLGATAGNVYTFYYAPDVVAVVAQYRNGTDTSKLVAEDAVQSGPYYYGEEYTLNAAAVTGWTVREGTQTFTITQTDKQEVMFLYDIVVYTVTYEPNNTVADNAKFSVNVNHGANSEIPANTFKGDAHMLFKGWSENPNPAADEKLVQPGDTISNVTASKTLYAIWVLEDKYSITYNANNGSLGTQTYDGGNYFADEPATALSNEVTGFTEPVGKKFIGWSTTENGEVKYAAGAEISMADMTDKQLYAVWADRTKNTITYNGGAVDGVSGTISGTTQPTKVEERFNNETAAVKDNADINFVLDGYKFDGWKDEQSKSWAVNETVPAGTDLSLTAQWAIDDAQWVTLTYDANGGADAPAQEKILRSALKATLAGKGAMTHGSNIFAGWSENPIALIATKVDYDAAQTQLVKEITFGTEPGYTAYAVWYLDANGPEGTDDGTPDALQFAVTYDANGGTGTAPTDSNIYTPGAEAPVKFETDLAKPGYTFLGWDTDANATEPTYTLTGKTTVTMPEGGVKLYAIYGANAVSYNVHYVSRRTNSEGKVQEKTLEEALGLAGSFGQTLTLTAKEITGYTLTSAATQDVTLGETGNDFTFYYAPNAATVVSHYLDSATNEKLLEDKNWGAGYQYGVTYKMEAPEITGFTATNPAVSFTIAGEVHEVTFLYTRNQYAYEIRYQNANGETLVVPTTGREAYKAAITAKPVAVPSYTPRNAELTLEIGTDETKNVITFIYDYTGGGGGVPDPDPDDDDDDDTSSSSTSSTPATSTPTAPITPVTPPEVIVTPPAQVEIDDEESPLAPGAQVTGPTEVIDDEETPLAAGIPSWALINLLLTILTALIMLALFIGYYTGKKKKEDEDENAQAAQAAVQTETEQEDEDDLKRKGWMRLLSIIPTVGAIIAFILTENMRNPMVLVDRWTLWMAVIALVQIGVAFCCRKERKDDKEDSNKEMPSTDVAPQNV